MCDGETGVIILERSRSENRSDDMQFEELDDESEGLLRGLLDSPTELPCSCNNMVAKELIDGEYVIGHYNMHGAGIICFISTVTQKGKMYFESKKKKMFSENRRDNMNFIELDSESEKVLQKIVEGYVNNKELFDDNNLCLQICDDVAVWQHLVSAGMLKGSVFEDITGLINFEVALDHKGKTYFEMKEKEQKKVANNINITADRNSNVQLVQGGTATQTVNYANGENVASTLKQFIDAVECSDVLEDEDKGELLEACREILPAMDNKNKFSIKGIAKTINDTLEKYTTLPSNMLTIWAALTEQIKI